MTGQTIELFVTIFASAGFWEFIRFQFAKRSKTTKLLIGVSHSQIIRLCNMYVKRGWITHAEYDDFLTYLYNPYEEFGANGLAQRMKQEVDKLPMRSDSESHLDEGDLLT